MAILKVLLSDKGNVVGTARTDVASSGSHGPKQATPVARAGQRVIEVTVDDAMMHLKPAELHAAIKARHVK